MRFSLRYALLALILGAISAVSASAETIQLGITGNAQVGSNVLAFGLDTAPDGGPYVASPGFGSFDVSLVMPGSIFQTLGLTVGQEGQIRSFSTASPSVTSPFITFNGSSISMTGSVPAGDFGPFFLQDTNFGAVASFNVSGNLLNGTMVLATYTGTFSASFNGINSAQLLQEIASGASIAAPFSATFSDDVVPTAPEPATMVLVGAGLLAVSLLTRRRNHRD